MAVSGGGASKEDVREVIRAELLPIHDTLDRHGFALAQLAEGQKVLLEDVAEIKKAVRDHEARIAALEV